MTTTLKTCFKCGTEKPLSDFYKHARMADGHLNKCKECTKSDSIGNRRRNHEKYLQYDRERSKLPHRAEMRRTYAPIYRAEHPDRRAAHLAVGSALRRGDLQKTNCIVCGSPSVEAHHPDYSRPLDVIWMCPMHHKQTHALAKGIHA